MSTIDEIKRALETCERRPDLMNFAAVKLMIASALADDRRDGAEQMREAAADAGYAAAFGSKDVREVYKAIRALPLPTGERQAVLLTDDDVWKSDVIMSANEAAGLPMYKLMRLVHAIQAESLSANNLEVRRG